MKASRVAWEDTVNEHWGRGHYVTWLDRKGHQQRSPAFGTLERAGEYAASLRGDRDKMSPVRDVRVVSEGQTAVSQEELIYE